MMKRCLLAFGLAVILPTATWGHHSWASNYRSTEPEIEITGVISEIEWMNPHVRMQVTADVGKPTATIWSIETSSVAQLSRMDVTPGLLKVGQVVKIAGYAGIRSNSSMYMTHLLLPDQREITFNVDATPRWSRAHIGSTSKLAGTIIETDVNKRPSSIFAVWNTVYGDPKSHSAAAQRASAAPNAATAPAGAPRPPAPAAVLPSDATYCAPKALPGAMGNPYPIQFLKNGKEVALKLEEYDQVRVIHIRENHDDSGAARSIMGYSTGVWVGQGERKLIVTTTKIDNKTLGPRTRLTETFELRADRNHLDYTATVSDPDKHGAPVTTSKYWQYRPGATVQPYNCSL